MSAPCDMQVLYSVASLLMTKEIRLHRKTGRFIKSTYGNEKYFSVTTVGLSGFAQIAEHLTALTRQRHAFVVRGEPLPDADRARCRRLLYPDDIDPATFEDAPRHWFAVDADKIPCPDHVDVVDDPDGAIDWLIGRLPPELYEGSCWWQFTASQGLPGNEGTLSARLWFWNSVPVDSASLRRWGAAANKVARRKLVDTGLYTAVQPHYLGDPIFVDMPDPVPQRCGVRHGLDEKVSLVIPEPDSDDPESYGERGFVGRGVAAFLAEIGGERGFRAPMVAAIASYFATNGPDADPAPIKMLVRQAIVATPRGGRSDDDINRYMSDRHLNDIIGWVRQHERANLRPKPAITPRLEELATAAPVAGERAAALRAIATLLLKMRYMPLLLALALVEAWNEQHCVPPLPRDQVSALVKALATRQVNREKGASRAG